MSDLKKKVEAILFSAARFMTLDEISNVCRKPTEEVKLVLNELKMDYDGDSDTAITVISEGDNWKMTTKDEHSNIVKKVVSETDLTKTQLETLAVIAFKYPIKQADLIRIRTNKAYDHITELETAGFITRQKYGRTKLIKLTDKFFEYFDLPKEKLKDRFKGFHDLATTIESKEDEIEGLKEEQKKHAEENAKEEEEERKLRNGELEIDLVDEKGKKYKLETFDEPKKRPQIEEIEETLDGLEIIDEEPTPEEEQQEPQKIKSMDEVFGNPQQEEEVQEEQPFLEEESTPEGNEAVEEIFKKNEEEGLESDKKAEEKEKKNEEEKEQKEKEESEKKHKEENPEESKENSLEPKKDNPGLDELKEEAEKLEDVEENQDEDKSGED